MGKKQPILDMMWGKQKISVNNSSFSLWRNRAGTLDKSTKSDMSFIFIYLQSNIFSDAGKNKESKQDILFHSFLSRKKLEQNTN